MFFGNFVSKKPENKREGISPNYNNPHKGFALPGIKRFLSGSLGFLFSFLCKSCWLKITPTPAPSFPHY
jgi:hypothetical protein